MAQNAEIFFEHDNWGRALGWSAGFHVALTALILLYSVVFTGSRGEGWGAGGGGSAIGVTLVSSVPLPATPAQTQNVLANESKGLTKSEPKVEEKEPDAIEIQGKNSKIKPKKPPTPTKAKRRARARGGNQPGCLRRRRPGQRSLWHFRCRWRQRRFRRHRRWRRLWHTIRLVRAGHSAESFRELAEVRGRSRITTAQRVYITFDVARDGHPFNVQVEQSSGVPSLDILGHARAAAHRHLRPAAPGLQRQQNLGGILVRLQQEINLCSCIDSGASIK